MDRPDGSGTAATYNYRHLLQLLAIKIRQREGQSLEAIKKEFSGVTGDALERRIATSLAPALGAGTAEAVAHDDDPARSWRRVDVTEGVEIHVRSDVSAARENAIVAMREAVRAALGREDVRD